MKTHNEVQQQIKKNKKTLLELEKQIVQVGRHSPMGINMQKQFEKIENDIKVLNWILS